MDQMSGGSPSSAPPENSTRSAETPYVNGLTSISTRIQPAAPDAGKSAPIRAWEAIDVLAQPGVPDRWSVLGQRNTEEDRLRAQRIWLWGTRTQRPALILNFAYGTQPFSDISLLPSTSVEATLGYFPGAYPLRALIKDRSGNAQAISVIPGYTSLKDAYAAYAAALTQQPWLEQFPLSLVDVVPVQRDQRWFLRDHEDRSLPLTTSFSKGWHLLALSGGRPITIFGEWNGDDLLPLSTWAEDHFVRLSE